MASTIILVLPHPSGINGIVNLNCQTSCSEVMCFFVSNNYFRVPDAPQGSGPYVEPGTGSLVLTEATSGDSGTYTCTAVNSFGSDSTSTEIVIIGNRGNMYNIM